MADQQAFSDIDIQSLAQKLTQFKQTLTPVEDAALAVVVLRGMPQAEDVAGFDEGPQGGQNVGAKGAQVGAGGDPFSIITNIFTVPSFEHDRPDRRGH
jgi:hypothetical protein